MTTISEHLELIRKVLSDKYCKIQVTNISIADDLQSESCNIQLCLLSGEVLEAVGVGMVAAIFSALKSYFAPRFKSLDSLQLVKFFVEAKAVGADAEVEVEVQIRNSYGKVFQFRDCSRSLIASSVRVSAAVVEYFVNAEQAFLLIHNAFQDARRRGREDLINRFEAELAFLVENTSYTELVETVRESLCETG